MITARDIFILEREMMQDLINLAYRANLTADEWGAFLEKTGANDLTIKEYDEIYKELSAKELTELDRVRNGETLKQSEINRAVKQAADRE